MSDKVIPSDVEVNYYASASDASLLRTLSMPNVENKAKRLLDLFYEPESKYNKDWIDPLSSPMRRILKLNKAQMQRVIYAGTPISTLSQQVYGTVSLWYVILMINGYCHPQEVERGATLYLPSRQQLDGILKTSAPTARGSIVRT